MDNLAVEAQKSAEENQAVSGLLHGSAEENQTVSGLLHGSAEEKQAVSGLLNGGAEYTSVDEGNKGDMMMVKDGPSEMIEDVDGLHTARRLDATESDGCGDSSVDGVPKIGMIFETENCAFEFYTEYSQRMGFRIRKGHQRTRACGMIQMKRFLCSKEGLRMELNLGIRRKKKRKPVRTGCKARMEIKLQEDGKYYVAAFEPQHNHVLEDGKFYVAAFEPRNNQVLETPRQACLLRSQRSVIQVPAAETDNPSRAEIRPKNAHTCMQRTTRLDIGYLSIAHRNHLHGKRKRALEKGVVGSLLEHFALMQVKDPGFFYAFQVDEDDLLTNVFWADSRMRGDYETFGDVVCFDTTFSKNNECRPFAPFVGINHHKQTIIFGACFLYDETADSFLWLFNTFVTAMSGKQPRTILTDQDIVMANAIASTLPNTIHRICVWHMYHNTTKNLKDLFVVTEGLKQDFARCVFDFDDEEDFLKAWENMLEKYNLRDNEWLKRLFEEKEKWALAYGRNTFCADMKSAQRSERMNKMLKAYLHVTYDLMLFFDHFQRMLDDLRNNELESDFTSCQSAMPLYVPVEKLKVASTFYTHAIFEDFLKELVNTHNLRVDGVVEVDRNIKYTIENIQTYCKHIALFNMENNLASCGCQKFEFEGVICCHLLKVYERRDIMEIPSHYFLKRWSKDAKSGIEVALPLFEEDNTIENAERRYHLLSRKAIKLSARAAESKETFFYIGQMMDKVLQDVDHRLRKQRIEEQCSNPSTSIDACQQIIDIGCSSETPHGGNMQTSKGFKQKEIKKRGAKRKPSCLEICKGLRNKKEKDSQVHMAQTPQATCNANPTCPLASQEHSSALCFESARSGSQFPQVQSPLEMQRQIEKLTVLVMEQQKKQGM